MTLRRIGVIGVSAVGALLVAVVLYVAFGDLGRHKGRIEAIATQALGRPFAIDGEFKLQVLPSIAVVAERVRLGNAQWGSKPQMVEVGRVSVGVGLWSLVSGPIDVRSFELSDVSVLLETNADGKGNWVFADAPASAPAAEPRPESAVAAPVVIRSAKLGNVRATYRERGKPDRVAVIETLTIGAGADGLLAISGKGSVNELPAMVSGELGPLDALVSGRNIRVAIQAGVGELKADIKGRLARLEPLGGADLVVKLAHPDIGTTLRKLHLPAVVTGPLSADVRLAEAGDLTRLDFDAKVGDIKVKVAGTLRALGLPGSDLKIEASVGDVARLANAFDVKGLPKGSLQVAGRLASSRTEIKVDALGASFAGAKAGVNGTVRLAREPSADLRFELAAESLRRLQPELPEMGLSMSGSFTGSRDKLEVKGLKGRIGETELSGRASLTATGRKQVEVDLASPLVDLAPFLAQKSAGEPKPKKTNAKFVLDDTPLPLGKPSPIDAKVHVALAEVRLGSEVLRDVDARLQMDGGGRMTLEAKARDNVEGTLGASVKLVPAKSGGVELDANVSATNVRPSLEAFAPKDAPPTNVAANLRTNGASLRQMASLANGRILVTQGPGKLKSGLLGLVGGDLIRELVGKLNPFAAQDPYLQLDCTAVWADIVDGQMTINPVLVQSQKVTIVASGKIDLGTEALAFSFNTRPRTGVGVSAGMFTNPFIEVAGTLANPRLGLGTKGATGAAAAVATGGISVLAQGAVDRTRGSQDLCKQTLEEVAAKAK